MATKYGQPSRITTAKVVLGLGLLAVVYLGFTFVPPYARYWRVHNLMREERSRVYVRRSEAESWERVESEATKRIRARLEEVLKLDPKDIHLTLKRETQVFVIKVEWDDVARYPFTSKTKPLHFSRETEAKLK